MVTSLVTVIVVDTGLDVGVADAWEAELLGVAVAVELLMLDVEGV